MAKTLLILAALLALLLGAGHSYLGERYLLRRLLRRSDLPKLFGSDLFTRRTLRFAWHLTSVAWAGFAALLALAAIHEGSASTELLRVISATFLASALAAGAGSRGRHPSWILFLAVAVLTWLAA